MVQSSPVIEQRALSRRCWPEGVVLSGWHPFGNVIVDDVWPVGAGTVMSTAFESSPS